MQTWQMQVAKARLSEVVKRAQSEGPQDITLHGQSVAVLLSHEAYEKPAAPQQNLAEFMRSSPLHGLEEINFLREDSFGRELEL